MDPVLMQLLQQLGGQNGGDYGYGIGDLLQYASPDVGGMSSKRANATLTAEGKQGNLLAQLLKMMSDPNNRIMLGTYAAQGGQSAATPWLDNALNSKTPEIAQVAKGLSDGSMDRGTALQILKTSTIGKNLSTAEIQSQIIDPIAKDLETKLTAKTNDPFTKMGLPSPTEKYTDNPSKVPMDSSISGDYAKYIKDLQTRSDTANSLSDSWKSGQHAPGQRNMSVGTKQVFMDLLRGPIPDKPFAPPAAWQMAPSSSVDPATGLAERGARAVAGLGGGLADLVGATPQGALSLVPPGQIHTTQSSPPPAAQGSASTERSYSSSGGMDPFASAPPTNPWLDQIDSSGRSLAEAKGRFTALQQAMAQHLDASGHTPLKDNLMQTFIKLLAARG